MPPTPEGIPRCPSDLVAQLAGERRGGGGSGGDGGRAVAAATVCHCGGLRPFPRCRGPAWAVGLIPGGPSAATRATGFLGGAHGHHMILGSLNSCIAKGSSARSKQESARNSALLSLLHLLGIKGEAGRREIGAGGIRGRLRKKNWGARRSIETQFDFASGSATLSGSSLDKQSGFGQITDDLAYGNPGVQAGSRTTRFKAESNPVAFSRLRLLAGSDRSNQHLVPNVPFHFFPTLEGAPANRQILRGAIGVMGHRVVAYLAIAFQIHPSHQARSHPGKQGPETSKYQQSSPAENPQSAWSAPLPHRS